MLSPLAWWEKKVRKVPCSPHAKELSLMSFKLIVEIITAGHLVMGKWTFHIHKFSLSFFPGISEVKFGVTKYQLSWKFVLLRGWFRRSLKFHLNNNQPTHYSLNPFYVWRNKVEKLCSIESKLSSNTLKEICFGKMEKKRRKTIMQSVDKWCEMKKSKMKIYIGKILPKEITREIDVFIRLEALKLNYESKYQIAACLAVHEKRVVRLIFHGVFCSHFYYHILWRHSGSNKNPLLGSICFHL